MNRRSIQFKGQRGKDRYIVLINVYSKCLKSKLVNVFSGEKHDANV